VEKNTMASNLLTSARHGAYLAIGLYVVMVVIVSLSSLAHTPTDAAIQVASPSLPLEHKTQSAGVLAHTADAGA